MVTLHMLLNAPAKVNLVDVATNAVLASAELDLLNLGWGQSGWEIVNVPLVIAPPPPDPVPTTTGALPVVPILPRVRHHTSFQAIM